MKYLITLPWMPYPATDGGKQGSFNMLMELQNMIDITLTNGLSIFVGKTITKG